MKRVTVAALAVLLAAPAASRAIDQSFVSAGGRDAAPCTRARPCRTFARAVAVTSAGGSVVALDSGRFASAYFVIDKALTITAAPGAHAEIYTSNFGIYVNAGADDVVVLRGLVFRGTPSTPNQAIVLNSAKALHVEDCVISGFPTHGIGTYGGTRQLLVRNTVIRDGFVGIYFWGTPASRLSLDRVRLENNDFGLYLNSGSATVRDSVATGNEHDGFAVEYGAEMNLQGCTASNNGTGIRATGLGAQRGLARVSGCVVTGNGVGIAAAGDGIVESRGDNTVAGNATDVSGTLTPLAAR
jgi:parallel beta-helix repeat protein